MLEKLIQILFPETNYERIVSNIEYLTPEASIGRVVTCCDYRNREVKAAISLLKRGVRSNSDQLLSTLLYDVLLEEVSEYDFWDRKQVVIIPMPISSKRRKERGFNQMERICELLPSPLKECVDTKVLKQVKNVPMQKKLSRKERIENVKDIFEVSGDLKGKTVILVDDVFTTGATMNEAIETLGCNVKAFALARA